MSLCLCGSLSAQVKTGLDVLVAQKFAPIAGKRVGVITNHSAITVDRKHIVEVLASPEAKAAGVTLVAIFVGEHGLSGQAAAGAQIESGKHEATGIPILSLYQKGSYRPSPEMYKGIDTLIYDMQDVGVRFYTYITTLGYTLEEAAKSKVAYVVLDRPNPINGVAVEGPLLDEKHFSFVGYMRMPIRPGMTVGELAQMYNGENKLGANLTVVRMEGWNRRMWFDQTGLEWQNPSPNIRNLTQAILYPGTCLVEGRQVSVGRGTDTPFGWFGAPWLKAGEMAAHLNRLNLPGVRFYPRRLRPADSVHKGQDCEGIDVHLVDRDKLDAVRMGLELVAAFFKLHPGQFEPRMTLLGSEDALARLKQGASGSAVNDAIQGDLTAFRKMREKYLLYQ